MQERDKQEPASVKEKDYFCNNSFVFGEWVCSFAYLIKHVERCSILALYYRHIQDVRSPLKCTINKKGTFWDI